MRQREAARVLGPYQEGSKWRIIVVDSAGGRRSLSAPTQRQAQAIAKREKKAQSSPVRRVLTSWCEARVREGKTHENTAAEQLDRVQRLLGDAVELPITALNDRQAQALYLAHHERVSDRTGKPLAAATHRFDLLLARFAWTWANREGYTASNPWDTVKPVGRPRKGKLQLRPSEAAQLTEQCYQEGAQGEDKAIGVLCCLEIGLRASEALALTKRDLDRGILFVEGTKTASARRRIELPPELRHQLELLGVARPEGPLIAGTRHDLHAFCKAICSRAGVPRVGPHALRGTHASLATLGGASVQAVARVLGHARARVTSQHYVSAEAEQVARVERVRANLHRDGIVPESFRPD